MAKGLRIPIGVDSAGRTATVEGDEQASKIIMLALGDNDNENAFQQEMGLGQKVIFDPNDGGARAVVLQRLYALFTAFETDKLYSLDRSTIKWTRADGDLILEFKYINLESDQVVTFRRSLKSGKAA